MGSVADRVRKFIKRQRPNGSHYQSRTQWEIGKELRRIEQSKRGQPERKPDPGGTDRKPG